MPLLEAIYMQNSYLLSGCYTITGQDVYVKDSYEYFTSHTFQHTNCLFARVITGCRNINGAFKYWAGLKDKHIHTIS